MALAYPGENGRLSEMMARDAFLSALDDIGLEVRVREREPVDLDAALRLAIRLEVYQNSTDKPPPPTAGPRNNRQVHSNGPSPNDQRLEELEKRFNEWRRTMEAKEEADIRSRATEQAKLKEEMERFVANAYGQKSTAPSDPPTWSRDLICYKCHHPGHISRHCPNRGSEPRPSSPTLNPATQAPPAAACPLPLATYSNQPVIASRSLSGDAGEIGRASCRERV